MKRLCSIVILTLAIMSFAFSQESHRLTVGAHPLGSLPLGLSSDYYTFGAGTEIAASYMPGSFNILGLKAGAGFLSLPLNSPSSDHSVRTLSGFAGPYLRFPLSERFSLWADGHIGYYLWGAGGWEADEAAGGGLVFGGGAGALFRVAGPFTLGAGVSYDQYAKLYRGINFTLSLSLDYPALEKEKSTLEIRKIELLPLFPVLYSYYAKYPVGKATIANAGKKQVNDIALQVYVDKYMDNPMTIGTPFSLAAGEEKSVDLYALFNEFPMEITEGTKTSIKITASHPGKKEVFAKSENGILEFYNRNAMMWDDDKKITSFITAKDPEIMNFAKNVTTWMQEVKNPALDDNLQKAMALFEGIKAYGIRYEVDPSTPFSEFSENTHAVDYLQFPRQTLQYTNGDCDDLTALYTALLEAVGVESAFITVPGHIYAAFCLKTPPDEAKKVFSNPSDLIFLDGKVWVPVEITMFQESFEKSWFTGAKQWREQRAVGQGELFPVREAWKTYQAVGFKEGGTGINLPDKGKVTNAVRTALDRHVEREIYPQVENLKKRLQQSQGDVRIRNSIAVVYARYGLYDKALEDFEAITRWEEYVPALINSANIRYLKGELTKSLDLYNRAIARDEKNKAALLGAARCYYDSENYGMSKKSYAKIMDLDPELAERFAFLALRGDETSRASAAAELKSVVVWEDAE